MADELSKNEYQERYNNLTNAQRQTVHAHALGVLELLAFDALGYPPLVEMNLAVRRGLEAAEATSS